MDPAEYLVFIPLLIYGIALADLLGTVRCFFDKEYFYLPYFISTLMFTEIAVWNIFIYLDVTSSLVGISYLRYWGYLLQPMIFLLMVSALTPEKENIDTEKHFKQRISVVYGLMALFVASHLFTGIGSFTTITYIRIVGAVYCLAIAITRKIWLIYVAVGIWLLSLLGRF